MTAEMRSFYIKEELKMPEAIRNLGAAVLLQATKDYVAGSEKTQRAILKDLRSPWLILLTDGMSETVARKLENNAEEISKRLNMTIPKDCLK